MRPRAIICAGEELAPRWNNYLGVTRHMIPASGEPILHRTQRQLLERDFSGVLVTCEPKRASQYLIPHVQTVTPPIRTGDLREYSVVWAYRSLLSSEQPSVLLFADTYYTDAFMDKLVETCDRDFLIYGRSTPSEPYQSSAPEHFATLLSPKALEIYLDHLESVFPVFSRCVEEGVSPPAGLAAYVQYGLYKTRLASGVADPYRYRVEWSDLTDDFDTPEDWHLKHKHFPGIFAYPCET